MNKVTLIAFVIGLKTILVSQTIPCSNFTITWSYPDTINSNDYQISINFNAGPDEFVNYPYVSAVLDCNGDTVATGGLFYFGQLGQTTQDYPVTILDTTSWCEPLNAIFIYGSGTLNEADTCILAFQSAAFGDVSEEQYVSIYPNPVSEFLHVSVSNDLIGKSYQIVNQLGQVVLTGKIDNKNLIFDLANIE
ncbi:MAG: T9SS type A sorting domain-containing protein, partial [Crocinitomicaceae bacterium]